MAVNDGMLIRATELYHFPLFLFSSTFPSQSYLGQWSAVLINFPNARTLPAGQWGMNIAIIITQNLI